MHNQTGKIVGADKNHDNMIEFLLPFFMQLDFIVTRILILEINTDATNYMDL